MIIIMVVVSGDRMYPSHIQTDADNHIILHYTGSTLLCKTDNIWIWYMVTFKTNVYATLSQHIHMTEVFSTSAGQICMTFSVGIHEDSGASDLSSNKTNHLEFPPSPTL